MWFLGIVIGAIVGAATLHGVNGGLAGALVGLIIGLALRSRTQIREREARTGELPAMRAVTAGNPVAPDSDIAARLDRMEERLRRIEANLGGVVADAAAVVPAAPATMAPPIAAPEPVPDVAWVFATAPDASRTIVPASADIFAPTPTTSGAASPMPTASNRMPNPIWTWFTGGNALTRIGVVVLFFGVAFLLKYVARYLTIPIEVRLLGVALTGAVLIGLGVKLAGERPGYGLSLQGAGAGILYLTVFAAFRYYEVLPVMAAFVLLAAVAVLTVGLAIRNDSQPLAGLAIAGGFLAPFLVDAHIGGPAILFGYFAVLNGAIFAVAWVRGWRALNVLGFAFTFVLGLGWGQQYYTPDNFATVEPFLVLFFLFYVAIAILYAKREGANAPAPVDALLVFGVPLTGFALQAALVRDTSYGVAWSAAAVAVNYGVLAAILRRRSEPGLALLARTFFVLAIIFATIAIPFAVDARWTSAWWALEAAAVYWIGCEQRQRLARAFALLLQVGAATAFVLGDLPEEGRWLLNATFFGGALIAVAGLATSCLADRAGDRIGATEHAVAPLVFAWGLLWWIGSGALEMHRHFPRSEEGNAMLAFVTLSVAVAIGLRVPLRWPRLAWFGAALLPVMAVVGWKDWQRAHTTLLAMGWILWPVAWGVHWWALRAAEATRPDGLRIELAQSGASIQPRAHTLSAIALVAWVAWEASEWVGRAMPQGTVWMACAAALPAIVYLGLAVRFADAPCWPLSRYRDAYVASAGMTIAALLGVWFAIVNVVSPGTPDPLPYLPIANPLDVTLAATLGALWIWAREYGRFDERTRYGWFGAALFLLVNAVVFRTMHQWSDVPWRLSAMLASRPLQAALTLTWTATALPLMVIARRRAIRPLWITGAVLLAIVVGKLFLLDLAALSGLPRVVAFLGVGMLLLLIGYLAPLPPAGSPSRPLERNATPR